MKTKNSSVRARRALLAVARADANMVLDELRTPAQKKQKYEPATLCDETMETMHASGIALEDVLYVETTHHRCTIDQFLDVASTIVYNSGHGLREISASLRIVGETFIMVRNEYDGAEWWEVHQLGCHKPWTDCIDRRDVLQNY